MSRAAAALGQHNEEREIFAFVDNVPVPQWDKIVQGASQCCCCRRTPSDLHNCRLCGLPACGQPQCSVKKQLPSRYEKKRKTGTSRVCARCYKQARAEKLSTMAQSANCKFIKPPRFVMDNAYNMCHSCAETFTTFGKGKRHHCRACGEMFCKRCTSLMTVPKIFIKDGRGSKKNEQTVCLPCQDKIAHGSYKLQTFEGEQFGQGLRNNKAEQLALIDDEAYGANRAVFIPENTEYTTTMPSQNPASYFRAFGGTEASERTMERYRREPGDRDKERPDTRVLGDWTTRWDEEQHAEYWENLVTGETKWTAPALVHNGTQDPREYDDAFGSGGGLQMAGGGPAGGRRLSWAQVAAGGSQGRGFAGQPPLVTGGSVQDRPRQSRIHGYSGRGHTEGPAGPKRVTGGSAIDSVAPGQQYYDAAAEREAIRTQAAEDAARQEYFARKGWGAPRPSGMVGHSGYGGNNHRTPGGGGGGHGGHRGHGRRHGGGSGRRHGGRSGL